MMSGSNVTSAQQWKKGAKSQGAEVKLPSGNTALLRRVDPQDLIASGSLPNALMPIVQKAMERAKGKPRTDEEEAKEDEQLQQELAQDPAALAQMMQLFDTVTLACVVEPTVQPTPANGAERDPELLYVDEVDFEDKMFITQYAMEGTADVEQFRGELEGDVAPRQRRQPMDRKTKQPARAAK
jgi:hypothetical protein